MKKAPQRSASAHQRRGSRAGTDAGFATCADDFITDLRGSPVPRAFSGACPFRHRRGQKRNGRSVPGRAGVITGDDRQRRSHARAGARGRRGGVSRAHRALTGASCSCTATGSSARCRTPRTWCRRRCWRPGGASRRSRAAPRVRAWLYRIATNRCLNALRARSRRPQGGTSHGPAARAHTPDRAGLARALPRRAARGHPGPHPGPRRATRPGRSIELAFIVALQHLPPRQRAALVLRDVLGFRTAEVAEMLDTGEASVKGALQRARATLEARLPAADRERAPRPNSARERELVGRFADAVETRRRRRGRLPAHRRRAAHDAAPAARVPGA